MIESRWFELDPDEFATLGSGTSPNPSTRLSTSPYDVPTAFRTYFSATRKRFIIEFQYIAPEATAIKSINRYVDAKVGRHSGRVYEIAFDMENFKNDQLADQASSALDVLGAKSHKADINFLIAKKAMERNRNEMFGA